VDFAFSDVAQNSTPFATTAGYATLTEDQSPYDSPYAPFTGVAVVPFTFAANASGIAAGISNFTTGDFQALFMASPGYIDQAWFNSTITPGTTPSVVAVGRYNLSGTRITAVLDNGASLLDPLYQWGLANLPPLGAGTNANVGVDYVAGLHQGDGNAPSGTTWVALTGDGFSTGYGPGGDGYFTGGNVGVALAAGSTTPAIAYIAFSDAQSKFKTSGALPIRWNGEVPYIGTYGSGNWNIAGLDNGDYQFWSYERLYENSADLGTKSAPSFMDKWGQDLIYGLQNEIITAVPQTAELEANMNVYRNADGGTVYPEVTPAAPN